MPNEPKPDDGPDLTTPGWWWAKIIKAIASDRHISKRDAARLLTKLYFGTQYDKAIEQSAKL